MEYSKKEIELLQLAVVKLVIEKESLEVQLDEEKGRSEQYARWWTEGKNEKEALEKQLSIITTIEKNTKDIQSYEDFVKKAIKTTIEKYSTREFHQNMINKVLFELKDVKYD